MMNRAYLDAARLLLDVAPEVFREPVFWSMMSCPHLRDMPALRWKLTNLQRLREANPAKFSAQYAALHERLGR